MAVKRCKSSFAVIVGGAPRVIPTGTLVDADDPVVKGREAYFEDVEAYVSDRSKPRVEQATAGPGEQRTVSPPAAKKAAAKRTPKKPPGGGE